VGARLTVGVGRVLRLPPDERRRVAAAAWQLTRASLEIRLLPSRRTVALLGPVYDGSPEERVGPAELREAKLVGHATARVAARLPWGPTCLPQALAVQRTLRDRGIPAQLHLGVTNASDAFAHAWVTVDGQPVIGGRGLDRFVPLAAFG
jgi:hypothetical protein